MKEIFILRHAKSSWDNTNLSDFDRPLAKRGIKDAKKLNNLLIKNNLKSSILVLNPVSKNKEIPEEEIKNIISNAIKKMNKKGVVGKKTTPFLLNEIANKTKNESLTTNIDLALSNIKVGAKIAKKL